MRYPINAIRGSNLRVLSNNRIHAREIREVAVPMGEASDIARYLKLAGYRDIAVKHGSHKAQVRYGD